jgi:CubicO group peptidase (beta-lactamase class C family)
MFLHMYLNGGEYAGKRYLSRKTVEIIMENQIGEIWGGSSGESHYGLAFGVLQQKGAAKGAKGSEGTFDWGGYFNTNYFADPKEKIIGVIMKQTQNINENSTNLFRQMIYQAVDN